MDKQSAATTSTATAAGADELEDNSIRTPHMTCSAIHRAVWKWAFKIAVMSSLVLSAVPSAAYTVSSARPRVLLTPSGVSTLRNRCVNDAAYRSVYLSLKNRVDSWTSPTTNRYVIGQQLQAVVLVALVENYNSAYITKVDQWIRNAFETQGIVGLAQSGDGGAIWGSSDTILGVAIALDWLYPALGATTRSRYALHLRDFQDAVIAQQGGMTRDASRSDYSNQFYYFDGMLAVSGLALYGEGVADGSAVTYLNTFDGYLRTNMLPVVNQVGAANGGWHEGLGYVNRGMTTFVTELEAWRTGTGEDVFPQASGLRTLSNWILHSTQPDGVVANIGDVSAWPTGWGQDTGKRSALLAARYRDGIAQYLANRVNVTAEWPYAFFYLLWHDSTVPEVNRSLLPTDQYFGGVGWVSMRSGWNNSDVFALFTSGNYYFGHQHYDQNSFQIFRSAPLAIDNGIYNVGSPSYKTATRFHNTILIGDPGSSTDDGAAGQIGASPQRFLANPESTTSNKGDIVRYETTPHYVLVVGDASRAYSSARLSGYIRKFLYVKPDYFLVVDRVTLPNATYPIRWMLQSDTQPTVAGRDVTVTNGSGVLQMRTLLPTDAALSTVSLFSGIAAYGGGNYRTDVIPGSRRTQETFVHVLRATAAPASTSSDGVLVRSSSGRLVGAQFGGHVALVADGGAVTTAESYTVAGSAETTHTIADLMPATSYSVARNGTLVTSVSSSPNGVLRFTALGGGTFTVTSSSASQPEAPRNLRIVP
jgi:hypothetical protein